MLSPHVYLEAIRRESLRFRDVLAAGDPSARVPACPDWDASDLVWHLAEVQWFWTQVIAARPAPPSPEWVRPTRPAAYDELLAVFDECSAGLVSTLSAAAPDDPAYHWLGDPHQTVGATYRRQAHEALVHRLDAEQTTSSVTSLDATLATDGVLEALEWMYGGTPPDGVTFSPAGGVVAFYLEDTDTSWFVSPGELVGGEHAGPHLLVVDEPDVAPEAEVRGTAGDVDAWLWKRVSDEVVAVTGDRSLVAALRAALAPALD
jgi:uncharacterized protein (TIGR03083 family)